MMSYQWDYLLARVRVYSHQARVETKAKKIFKKQNGKHQRKCSLLRSLSLGLNEHKSLHTHWPIWENHQGCHTVSERFKRFTDSVRIDSGIELSIFIRNYFPKLCFLPPATKLGQGYIFTGMCDSVHRGGSASVHAGIPPTPRSRHLPQSKHPPKQTPLPHAGRYRQCTGGMHPTGMQSCYRPQQSCGQGNIFTPVCHSVHRGGRGSASVHAGIPPREQTAPPRADTHPPEQTPHPPEQTPHPPGADTPAGKQTPAYGLRAAGTHPTGMHFCFCLFFWTGRGWRRGIHNH